MAKNGKYEMTKSYCKFRGVITGLTNPRKGYGFAEGTDSKGEKYRSFRCSVKTSEDNIIPVEIFGSVQPKAYFYSRTKKETKEVDWAKRLSVKMEGYEPIVPDYDKAKELNETLKDGDAVVVLGEVQHSEYTPKGKTIAEQQTKYVIKSIFPATEEVDLKAEGFVEEAIFEEEVIINEVSEIAKENKLIILAYTVGYGDRFTSATYEVNTETADPQFVKNLKGLKFGDFIKLSGFAHNRAIHETISSNEGWGQTTRQVKTYRKALEVTGAYGETLEKGKYTLEQITEAIADTDSKIKAKNQGFNPTKTNVADVVSNVSDEDLPFDI